MQNVLFYVLEGEMYVQNVRLRYFTIFGNVDEYKRMSQDLSLGQLYDVHNEIKISRTPLLGLLIYYHNLCIYIPP